MQAQSLLTLVIRIYPTSTSFPNNDDPVRHASGYPLSQRSGTFSPSDSQVVTHKDG